MTLGSPLVSPAAEGCCVPVDRPDRSGRRERRSARNGWPLSKLVRRPNRR